MALIKCPNCQKDVSSMVTYCPFCSADLTHINASAAHSSDSYYNPNVGVSSSHPDHPSVSGDYGDFSIHDSDANEFFSESPEYNSSRQGRSSADNRQGRSTIDNRQGHSAASSDYQTSGKQSADASDASSGYRRGRRQAPYGRRLLGYRAGNPIYMLISIFYHMAACVGLLYAISFTPQYLTNGTLIFHLCRLILAAAMLFLPVLLLTENKVRRNLPFFSSKTQSLTAVGFLLLYIPLAVLFAISWYFCL